MPQFRTGSVGGQRRRWSFANCVFDEANWALTVEGARVPVEAKPLELLRQLLLRAGDVVTKDELLDSIWGDVTVVEASLTTAVRKLRLAIGDDRRERAIIETVSGIGYRLAVPVTVDTANGASAAAAAATDVEAAPVATSGRSRPGLLIGMVLVASAAIAIIQWRTENDASRKIEFTPAQREQLNALRKLDVEAVDRLLAAGWDPDAPYDKDGNGALNIALNICEWDPGHDQRKLLLLARTLIDANAHLDRHNRWGDTPYSIAKAKRYCGPDHPVTKMMRTLCYSGGFPAGDRCLATYERKKA